jgi:kumamolisin
MRRFAVTTMAIAVIAGGLVYLGLAANERTVGTAQVGATADRDRIVRFSVDLRIKRQALNRALLHLHLDKTPLAPREFGARFGLSARALARARRKIESYGVDVTRVYPQRTAFAVRASIGTIEDVFGVRLSRAVDQRGRWFIHPTTKLRIPRSLTAVVSGISGLNTRRTVAPLDVSRGGLSPRDAARAYDVLPLWRRGIKGQRETIAVLVHGVFDAHDVEAFDATAGIDRPLPTRHVVNGGSSDTTGIGAREATMDVEIIRAIAPASRILVYELGQETASGLTAGLNAAVADGRARIISISEGLSDVSSIEGQPWLDAADRVAGETALAAAAATGITVFVASGDHGAYDCQSATPVAQRLCVSWPADSPFAVAVGGTRLSVAKDRGYLSEDAWEDVLEGLGSGGGVNPVAPRPSWQKGPGVKNHYSNGKRQVPDVAAAADADTPFAIRFLEQSQAGYGTSAAAPFWAAVAALCDQFARAKGTGRIGFLPPLLYRVAKTHPSPFHDVVRGGNRFYEAAPGWDYATGLGSPDTWLLARTLEAEVRRRKG